MTTSEVKTDRRGRGPHLIGVVAGIADAVIVLLFFAPDGLGRSAQLVASVGVLMAI